MASRGAAASRAAANNSRGRSRKKVEIKELGSYERVLAAFRKYDIDMNGTISTQELHKLMNDLNAGRWTEVETDRLFHSIDKNHNGSIDINELLDYIFGHDKDSGCIGNAGKSDYEMVLEDFRRFDTNRNGTLDKQEFTKLMGTLNQGKWDARQTDAVFKQVDVDGSGEVDLNELVAFIFGVPRDRVKAAAHGSQEPLVVVEFTLGPGAPETMCKHIATLWHKKFGSDILVRKIVEPSVRGISKVTARDGLIVFWDEAVMVAYRENPFLTMGSMKLWVDDMTRRHLPRLLEGTRAMVGASRR